MRTEFGSAELRIDGGPVIEVTDWSPHAEEAAKKLAMRYRREVMLRRWGVPAPYFFPWLVRSRSLALTHNILPAVAS